MNNIIIFSGTTEGRILSDMLVNEGIHHIVCVASDYGKEMMRDSSFAEVHVGRMDAKAMSRFFTDRGMAKEDLVIDATHPYATEVTANIKASADTLGIRYLRVVRQGEGNLSANFCSYDDIEECAKAIDKTSGNILLTTGSKELSRFCANVSKETRERTYVRVLPSIDSLKLCEAEAIEPSHIIAMHGPFNQELNESLIQQYDIKHLITKESGATGGFKEKKNAAESTGIKLHVIARPTAEDGVSIYDVYRFITGKDGVTKANNSNLHISLVGMGMGAESSLTIGAIEALSVCDAVFGAERLIRNIYCGVKYAMYRADDIIPVLERENIVRAAIVFSGDTGFYSGSKAMIKALKQWRNDVDIQVIPGISSFSYLAACAGESYDDAVLFSIHGKNTACDMNALLDRVKYSGKVFTLLSGAKDISVIAKKMIESEIEGKIIVGANLSYENEIVRELSLEEAEAFDCGGGVTALICNNAPQRRPLINIKKDSDFVRASVPMTKECIRHESIIRLGLREGDVFYDIGGGTGSVAIEAASLHPSLKVSTIEKKSDAALLLRENVEKSGLGNITVIEDEAVNALKAMERPDAVFVGGSGGNLREIIEILHSKGEGIRFVINAVSLETIDEVRAIIREYEPADEETIVISVSDVQKLGSYHMIKGQNPIWIFSFTI